MDFLLDGIVQGSYTTPANLSVPGLNHQPIWTSGNLPPGPHVLVMRQQTSRSYRLNAICLDYLTYTPSTEFPPSTPSFTYLLDDRHPAIRYDTNWIGSPSVNWMGLTAHQSTHSNAELKVDFEGMSLILRLDSCSFFILEFTGTRIQLFGDVTKAPGRVTQASFSLDDGPPSSLTSGVITNPATNSRGQRLYDSGQLALANHTLHLTVVRDDPILVDYFLVDTSTVWVQSGIKSIPPAPPVATKNTKVSVIAASVVGGAVGIILVLGALFLLRKRRRSFRRRRVADSGELSAFTRSSANNI